jgi:NADH:ubiquinone oxidoreductase subunit K
MILVATVLGGLGLICMLYKKTLLGFMIGLQLLVLGATMIFVVAGVSSGGPLQGHVFGLFITFGSLGQLVVGYALAIRLFYLKKRVGMDDLRSLKH